MELINYCSELLDISHTLDIYFMYNSRNVNLALIVSIFEPYSQHIRDMVDVEELFELSIQWYGTLCKTAHFIFSISCQQTKGKPLLSKIQFLRYTPPVLPCD